MTTRTVRQRLLGGLPPAIIPWFVHAADVEVRSAVIVSEGVRLHAEIYLAIDWFDQYLKK